MGIIAFPWFARDSGMIEWGIACQGCESAFLLGSSQLPYDEYLKWRLETHTLYNKQQYLRQFLNCTEAMNSLIQNYESKLANGVYLRTRPDSLCHIAGDPREHAYDELVSRTSEERVAARADAARSRANYIMLQRPHHSSR